MCTQEIPDSLDDNLMILILLQAADDNDGDDTLDSSDPDGPAAAMDGIFGSGSTEGVLGGKGQLVLLELVAHEPRADAEAQDRLLLARDPVRVVGRGAALDGAVEQRRPVGQGNGHARRGRKRLQARAQQAA